MKKFIFISVVSLLLALSFNAYSADEGFYVSGIAGAALTNNSDVLSGGESIELGYDTGWILGLAGGVDFGD